MSLFQSLTVAVAGMQSQANKLGVVSDNVANVNTVGYKAGVANFSSLVHGFKGGGYLAGGVKPGHQQTNQKGGNVSVTDSVTDLTISGRGFFPVSETSTGTLIRYTRAGSFTTNKAGDYLNSSGYFLKGWRLDDAGNLPTGLDSPTITQSTAEAALQTINVANITIAAIPTTSIALQANLNAGDRVVPNNSVNFIGNVIPTQAALITTGVDINTTLKTSQSPTTVVGYDPIDALHNMTSGVVPADYETTLTVYDAGGKARTLNVSYLKTAANSWAVEVSASPTTSITPTVGNPVGLVASGNLTFNADGTLASASPALTAATNITWLTPSSTNAITFDFGTVGTADGVKEQATPSTTTVNLVSNLNSLQTTTAVVGYNPLDSLHNMASGVVAPHYTTPLTMYDASGTARTVNVSYLKTSTGQWAVEIYAPLASDITPAVGNPAGLIASGNLVFNSSTGALSSISAGLSGAAAVTWNSPASTSTR